MKCKQQAAGRWHVEIFVTIEVMKAMIRFLYKRALCLIAACPRAAQAVVGKIATSSTEQQCLPAAKAPMKSDAVMRMGIVMIGRCREVSGGSGLRAGGPVSVTSLVLLCPSCCSFDSEGCSAEQVLLFRRLQ